MNENPVKSHWLLPTVTLGNKLDKFIPWGATVSSDKGEFIYTSFTPLGFLAPYLWFKAFDLQPIVENLAYFNFLLGGLTSLILFCLLVDVLKYNGHSPWIANASALLGSTIGIFSRESLQSHGIIYWNHSLYQLIMASTLYLVFKYSTCEEVRMRIRFELLIIVAVFFGALTEWTGYIFNGGLVLLLWLFFSDQADVKTFIKRILISTTFAATLTVLHFSLAIDFASIVRAYMERFFVRGISTGSIYGLIEGYGLSYGLFIFATAVPLVTYFFGINYPKIKRVLFFIFIVACIPLIENIFMLQHATQFSFDRLKFIFPASMILAVSFARFGYKGRAFLVLIVLLSCFFGFEEYRRDNNNYSAWKIIDEKNRNIASKILENVDSSCAIFSQNIVARGYSNLLFRRGIYENKSIHDANALFAKSDACVSVYLEGVDAFPDLPQYSKALVIQKDGSISSISDSVDLH